MTLYSPVNLSISTQNDVDGSQARERVSSAAPKQMPTDIERRRFDAALRGSTTSAARQALNGAGMRRPSTSGLPKPDPRGTTSPLEVSRLQVLGRPDVESVDDDADAAQSSDGSDDASEVDRGFAPLLCGRLGEDDASGGGQEGHEEHEQESADENALVAQVLAMSALPVPNMPSIQQTSEPETSDSQASRIVQDLLEQIGQVVQNMRVSVDADDHRAVEFDLKPSVISDVTVRIEAEDNLWCVTFVCRREPPRERLCEVAPVFANTLATRLGRDVVVRVRTDDEEDLRLFEVRGQA